MSPTQRSIARLKSDGYRVAIVERWNPYAKIRQDLFGFIDLLAIKAGSPILAIQATTTGNIPARIKKIEALDASQIWRRTGNLLQVWGWSKKGARGKRKLWELTIRSIFLRSGTF